MPSPQSPVPASQPQAVLPPEMLLSLLQTMLAEYPLGILLLDSSGNHLWHNGEAALVCALWNRSRKGADQLPLEHTELVVPDQLRTACLDLAKSSRGKSTQSLLEIVSDHDLGLLARIQLQAAGPRSFFFLRLDYRRPRSDRDNAMSERAVALLGRLTPREREVAVRVRDGLPTAEVAKALCRSPLTVKAQLANVYQKLHVKNRTHLAVLLNR